jgi:GNAT superfamily N-acetyltransferase
MTLEIRPVNPETDHEQIARLYTIINDHITTASTLDEWYREPFAADYVLYRAVGIDLNGRIIGYILVEHETTYEPGRFTLMVMVDPAHRNQGIGAQLYDHALRQAEVLGAATYYAGVRENQPNALRFAEARGFKIQRYTFESTIDLRTFDETPFSGMVESLATAGIRFFSLADMGDTEEARRKLHRVNFEVVRDNPGATGDYIGFDEFNEMFNTASWFRSAGQMIAADGDDYIGLAAVGYFAETNSMYNLITGVMPAYRGRKIAQALKLLTIRYAKAYGADHIRTHNDSENEPMLAINRRLGYQAQVGIYRLGKA